MVDINEKLALLTDTQAHNVLNRVIEGFVARNPNIPVGDVKALTVILTTIGEAAGESVVPRIDSELTDKAVAERSLLVEMSRNPKQRGFVEGAIASNRQVLVEPITIALVMAGIVFVLETEYDVKVSRKHGKTEYDVHVGKKPADRSVITKFFSLFS
jgi:hypothetical protein